MAAFSASNSHKQCQPEGSQTRRFGLVLPPLLSALGAQSAEHDEGPCV